METVCTAPSAVGCLPTEAVIVVIAQRAAVCIFHLLMGCGTVETALLLIGFRRSPLIVPAWDRLRGNDNGTTETTLGQRCPIPWIRS